MDLPALTQPEHLGWLALLPLLWWLSRPHRPRRLAATPHLLQWLRAQQRLRRRPVRFRWWRFLLLALAYGACVLALCAPNRGGRDGPRALVVLLDTSASLAAPAGDPSWRRVREVLERELRALPDKVSVRLALCGSSVRVVEGDVDDLLAAVPERPAGAGAVDLEQLAEQLRATASGVATWTITDGLGPTSPPRSGALTIVGGPLPNAGITACEIEDHWPLPEVELRLEVRSFGAEAASYRIAAEGGVEAAPPTAVELDARGRGTAAISLRRTEGGALRVHLAEHADGLAADDAVVVDLPAPPAVDIAVQADEEPGPWLDVAAEALARETGGRVVRGDDVERAGFLIVDGGILAQPAGSMRFLTFGTRAGHQPLTADDMVIRPQIIDWSRTDPLTRGLDLSELSVAACLRRDFIGSGTVLIEAEHGPLMVAHEGERWTSIHAAFRLRDSNLPLLPAFPQLLRRCFARSFGRLSEPHLAAGSLLSADESDLRRGAPPEAYADRPLPAFGRPGTSLVVPLLVVALGALALRVYA